MESESCCSGSAIPTIAAACNASQWDVRVAPPSGLAVPSVTGLYFPGRDTKVPYKTAANSQTHHLKVVPEVM